MTSGYLHERKREREKARENPRNLLMDTSEKVKATSMMTTLMSVHKYRERCKGSSNIHTDSHDEPCSHQGELWMNTVSFTKQIKGVNLANQRFEETTLT